jgi:lysyl-tRNA synthetase class 2
MIRTGLRVTVTPTQSPFRARLTQARAASSASPDKAFQERVQEIKNACAEPYPRLPVDRRTLSCAEFRERYSGLSNNESVEDTVVVSGR